MDETFSPDPIEVTRIFMRDGCFYLARDVKKLLGPGSESGNHALLRRAIQLDEAGATRRATKAEFQYLSSVLGLAGGVPTLVASTAVEPALRTRSVPLHIIRFLMDVRPPEGLAQAPPGGPAPGPAARPNILPQVREILLVIVSRGQQWRIWLAQCRTAPQAHGGMRLSHAEQRGVGKEGRIWLAYVEPVSHGSGREGMWLTQAETHHMAQKWFGLESITWVRRGRDVVD